MKPALGLVLAMSLSYLMCFAGLIFAFVNYRRRQRDPAQKGGKEPSQP
jgi:hypothetical protein